MMSYLIAFTAPWLLAAVVALPLLWWLLRLAPPPPRQVRFPAVWLLRELVAAEETPARTPWWLLLLRLLVALLVIVALAGPVWHPASLLPGQGPLLLVIDDGWAAAPGWPARQRLAAALLTQAERQGRPVVVATTAPQALPGSTDGSAMSARPRLTSAMPAADARRLVQGLVPQPWPVDRAATRALLQQQAPASPDGRHTVWLSDGLNDPGAAALAGFLTGDETGGSLELVAEPPAALPILLLPPVNDGERLVARLLRAAEAPGRPALPARTVAVRLSAGDGRLLAQETASFAAGATSAEVRLSLPSALRNQAARLSLEGQASAAAVVVLDERWRWRPVGLITAEREAEEVPPLLSDRHYLERALAPGSEVRVGSAADLSAGGVAVMVLGDNGPLSGPDLKTLSDWVDGGGLLVRFAGPRLARAPDTLLPVRLRLGDRTLGGALSWTKPARLAPFEAASPFAGLAVPAEIAVERQVLAEPTLDTADHTWARLTDGTPLITAARRGQGTLVLIHTSANPEWSNLALSGLFVELLHRLVALSAGVAGSNGGEGLLAPLELLDGLGRLGEPAATALPIPSARFAETRAGPRHPPGFYGTPEAKRALNLTASLAAPQPLPALSPAVERTRYDRGDELPLRPALLLAALLLLLLDMAIALHLRGYLIPRPGQS